MYEKKIVREWKPTSQAETFAGRNFGVFDHFCESLSREIKLVVNL